MLTSVCRETGLNCDYIIKGEIEEDILKNGAERATQVHGLAHDTSSWRVGKLYWRYTIF